MKLVNTANYRALYSVYGVRVLFVVLYLLSTVQCIAQNAHDKVLTGAEILIRDELAALQGKRIGAVLNHTAIVEHTHLIDTLRSLGVNITAIFAPEHGFRGNAEAGATIRDGTDPITGITIHSLYGSTMRPSPDMLQGLDLILFDIQDVGARFYTYNTTLKYVIEAASEQGIPVWILDRPNPAGGDYIAGWLLEEEFKSFVGSYPVPVAHGLTLGELALMAVGEGWISTLVTEDLLRVIPMEGWKRRMKWPDTNLNWTAPSPNLPSFKHAYTYLGMCLIEGTTLSEGRGTEDPFLLVGAPDLNMDTLALKQLGSEYGYELDFLSFTPRSIKGVSEYPKFKDRLVDGFRLSFKDDIPRDPVGFGVKLTRALIQGDSSAEFNAFIYRLAGTEKIIMASDPGWDQQVKFFRKKRAPYLIYH